MVPSPSGAKPLNTLNPKIQGRERIRIAARFTRVDFFLVQPNRSMPKQMIFSNTAMTVDRAAKLMNRKKSAPKIRPPAIWLKMLGRVTNTSPGPSPGFTSKAKQAGKMTRPDSRATVVSRQQIRTDSPVRA